MVEGPEGGLVAGVTKIHHSAIDGSDGSDARTHHHPHGPDTQPDPAPAPSADTEINRRRRARGRMLAYHPFGPVVDPAGLNITATSTVTTSSSGSSRASTAVPPSR